MGTTTSPVVCNVNGLKIPQQILSEMVAHAKERAPYECCGLLAGTNNQVDRHYRITNRVAEDDKAIKVFSEANVKHLKGLSDDTKAEVAYFMDPKEMLQAFKDMRAHDRELLVIYHSHTHSPAYPSETDVGLAYYPEVAYLIISLANAQDPDIKAFHIRDNQILPLSVIPL